MSKADMLGKMYCLTTCSNNVKDCMVAKDMGRDFCPKCGSEKIDIVCLDTPVEKKVARQSIDDGLYAQSNVVYAVMTYTRYRLKCKQCRHFKECFDPPLPDFNPLTEDDILRLYRD